MSQPRPALLLAPSVSTTTVTTTTTTTTTYQPIPLPSLPVPSSPKDSKQYPLLNAPLPKSLKKFPLSFPNGARATFKADLNAVTVEDTSESESDEPPSGRTWRMLKREEAAPKNEVVGFDEALERFGRKRLLSTYGSESVMMEGIESASLNTPPRKRVRGTTLEPIRVLNSVSHAGPPSPLPSPGGSPPAENIWDEGPLQGQDSMSDIPIHPDLSLTTLMTLPNLVSHFSSLPAQLQSHVLLTLIRHSPLPVIRTVHSVIVPSMARDFLSLLPPELTVQVLGFLPYTALCRASRVCKAWRSVIDSDPHVWGELLKASGLWFGGVTEEAFVRAILARRHRLGISRYGSLLPPHPLKILFKSRHLTRNRWIHNQHPRQISFQAHGNAVVTCLLLSHGRIISASDDHSIQIYSPKTGELLRTLQGHSGGVWALAATRDTLVSGSTDRTVRIWDLETGRCKHVFGGHSSTVRCLAIIKPEWLTIADRTGRLSQEKWPKRPLIVTGSRDHTLRVWDLPRPTDKEYRCFGADEAEGDPADEDVEENPYHKLLLSGHDHAVRALAARGRTLVSGSYDCTVRVWDIMTGKVRWVLIGHTQKVYSVVYDPSRNQASSGSMDGTVRIWDLVTGQCRHVLSGHTSLVGLLGLSPNHLVSAAADATLRVWNPESGDLHHALQAHTGAITCFQHDEFKILSGSDGTLKMWDIRDGTVCRDLLTGVTGVWQVVFEGRWCVAASNRPEATFLDVWDFGRDSDDEEDWFGEADGSLYDEDFDGEFERRRLMLDEDEEDEEAVAMDLELSNQERPPDDIESVSMEEPAPSVPPSNSQDSSCEPEDVDGAAQDAGPWATPNHQRVMANSPSTSSTVPRAVAGLLEHQLSLDDNTPTRPKRSRMLGGSAASGSRNRRA